MMTYTQRKAWANYLKGAGIAYRFFSAQLAKEMLEAQESGSEDEEEEEEAGPSGSGASLKQQEADEESEVDSEEGAEEGAEQEEDGEADTRILTVDELEDMLLQYAPKDAGE
jgi:large subunit GTPase 1